jgi:predicted metal-dependent peptidase
MDTRTKVTAARVRLLEITPYLAPAIMRMPLLITERLPVPTAACDAKGRILVHPKFIERLDVRELCAVILHETLHYVYLHHPRMIGRDAEVFNIAADVLINEQIAEMGLPLPAGCVTRALYKVPAEHKTAEAVYDWLMSQGAGGAGGKGKGDGTCATGAIGQDTSIGDGEGAASIDGEDGEMMRDQIAAEIAQHAQRGNMPAGLRVWAEERTGPPRVNWRSRLAALLARANSTFVRGRVTSDWRRVSRRAGAVGVHLPGRVQPLPRIACVIDTSGSMHGEGGAVLSEAMGIVQAAGAAVDMLSCDAQAGRVVAVERLADLRDALTGGGGTDLQPAIDALAPVSRYSAIIVFTDGYLDPVQIPPGPRVVWCITAHGERRDWMRGDVLQLER